MDESDFNKREERGFKTSSQVQSNYGRAKIRKVGTGVDVSFKGGNVAGRKSLVYNTDLQARQTNSMANAKVNYKKPTRLENQRDGIELYSIRCHDCD